MGAGPFVGPCGRATTPRLKVRHRQRHHRIAIFEGRSARYPTCGHLEQSGIDDNFSFTCTPIAVLAGPESDAGASATPSTVEGTAIRSSGTTEIDHEMVRPMVVNFEGFCGDSGSCAWVPRWKVGAEPPPFVSTNGSVIRLLMSIVDDNIDVIPSIVVSNAVAVQIYRLLFDRFTRAAQLKDANITDRGLYIILASLVRGTRTEPPTPNAVKNLKQYLGRAL